MNHRTSKLAARQRDSGPTTPRQREGREHTAPAFTTKQLDTITSFDQLASTDPVVPQPYSTRTVDWWAVHLYRERMLRQFGVQTFPMVGTLAWEALADDHPAKLAAVVDAAQHWALRLDARQEAMADASRAVAAAVDWQTQARRTRDRTEFARANPWALRVIPR
jgi:hypothetical protein